jgi:hypothetical protein
MGCHCDHPLYISLDLYLHRSSKQLPSRKYPRLVVCSHLTPGTELTSSYLVLVMGFYFAPNRGQGDVEVPEGLVPTLGHTLTKLWA